MRNDFIKKIIEFLSQCKVNENYGFKSKPQGEINLYSSCFAVMINHYIDSLKTFNIKQKKDWANYINQFQDENSGYFIGPEIVDEELTSQKHSKEHILMHLVAHVLPALILLKSKPKYPLKFAHKFMDIEYLKQWLSERDWTDAWLEGNNLIFIIQFLIFLRDFEKLNQADKALSFLFKWLDDTIDPNTGLWGSNGYCTNFVAMCGGYHQLIGYIYEKREILYPKQLINTILELQHKDGGFSPNGGGGACEDIDAVYLLVNLVNITNYRKKDIIKALKKNLFSIMHMFNEDGGFVYKRNSNFSHMGIKKTFSNVNESNMFATWFRLHTIASISKLVKIKNDYITEFNYQFNKDCSMGYMPEKFKFSPYIEKKYKLIKNNLFYYKKKFIFNFFDFLIKNPKLIFSYFCRKIKNVIKKLKQLMKKIIKKIILKFISFFIKRISFKKHLFSLFKKEILKQNEKDFKEMVFNTIMEKIISQPPKKSLEILFDIDQKLYHLQGQESIRYGNGVHTKHKHIKYHDFFIQNIDKKSKILDIGCGIGALAADIADNVRDVNIYGIDISKQNIDFAMKNFFRENINYVCGDALNNLPKKHFDIIILSNVLEHIDKRVFFLKKIVELYTPKKILIRIPIFERDWRVPLKKELGLDYRLDTTHYIEYLQEEFWQEVKDSGLKSNHYQIKWGEIWAELESI